METIDKYTIHCTTTQTKKALELGAQIEVDFTFNLKTVIINKIAYIVPTAEQMVGFLEGIEDINEISIIKSLRGWIFVVYVRGVPLDIEDSKDTFYPTRPEATLAAIDATLDYLISKE